ncbi:MAG: flagellar biosynthetic protein FliO [Spirochaetaceae bacterium]|nr:flagellar biosynthetic protein FliO [Spirochaetaceae bacterium]
MGGEKLKPFRITAGLALCLVFTGVLLHAQVPDPADTGENRNAGELSGAESPRAESGVAEDAAGLPDALPLTDIQPFESGENLLLLDEELPPLPASGGASGFFPVFRMVLVLALAAAAVYGLVYFFRRLSRPQPVQDTFLKVLSSVHLGSNRYAHVVSVGSSAYLVGAGDSGVTLIAEIEDREIIDAMLLEESRKASEGGKPLDFKKLLRRFSGQGPAPEIPGADSIKKRRERFRGL